MPQSSFLLPASHHLDHPRALTPGPTGCHLPWPELSPDLGALYPPASPTPLLSNRHVAVGDSNGTHYETPAAPDGGHTQPAVHTPVAMRSLPPAACCVCRAGSSQRPLLSTCHPPSQPTYLWSHLASKGPAARTGRRLCGRLGAGGQVYSPKRGRTSQG